jgi:hypothetical protein
MPKSKSKQAVHRPKPMKHAAARSTRPWLASTSARVVTWTTRDYTNLMRALAEKQGRDPADYPDLPPRNLRMRDLVELTGLSQSILYELMARGAFPRGIAMDVAAIVAAVAKPAPNNTAGRQRRANMTLIRADMRLGRYPDFLKPQRPRIGRDAAHIRPAAVSDRARKLTGDRRKKRGGGVPSPNRLFWLAWSQQAATRRSENVAKRSKNSVAVGHQSMDTPMQESPIKTSQKWCSDLALRRLRGAAPDRSAKLNDVGFVSKILQVVTTSALTKGLLYELHRLF